MTMPQNPMGDELHRRRRRPLPNPFDILSYGIAAISLSVGLIVCTGFLLPVYVPAQIRWTFGIVLVLMGVYRIVITMTRAKQRRDEENE